MTSHGWSDGRYFRSVPAWLTNAKEVRLNPEGGERQSSRLQPGSELVCNRFQPRVPPTRPPVAIHTDPSGDAERRSISWSSLLSVSELRRLTGAFVSSANGRTSRSGYPT